MKKTIYLHIGTHKTGTSAIQIFLHKNRQRLEKQSFHYPSFQYKDIPEIDWGNEMSHKLAWKLGFGADCYVKAASAIENDFFIHRSLSNCDNLIISSEVFCENVNQDNLQNLKEYSERLSIDDLKIIVYLRRQDSFLESAYQQMVKSGGIYGSIEDIKMHLKHRYLILNAYADFFGPQTVIVRPYETSQFTGGNIFNDFAAIVGLDITNGFQMPERTRTNIGWNPDLIWIKRVANKYFKDPPKLNELQKILQQYFDHQLGCPPEHYGLLSEVQRKQILNEWDEWNKAVARGYLKRQDGCLFYDQPGNVDKPHYSGLSLNNTITIIEHIHLASREISQLLLESSCQGIECEDNSIRAISEVILLGYEIKGYFTKKEV